MGSRAIGPATAIGELSRRLGVSGRGLRGVFAQPPRRPRFVRMLWQVRRLRRRALAFLRMTDEQDLTTYGEFLEREGFSGYFIAHYG